MSGWQSYKISPRGLAKINHNVIRRFLSVTATAPQKNTREIIANVELQWSPKREILWRRIRKTNHERAVLLGLMPSGTTRWGPTCRTAVWTVTGLFIGPDVKAPMPYCFKPIHVEKKSGYELYARVSQYDTVRSGMFLVELMKSLR